MAQQADITEVINLRKGFQFGTVSRNAALFCEHRGTESCFKVSLHCNRCCARESITLVMVRRRLQLQAYDHMLTFDDERQHIWQTKMSYVKLLFFAGRYLPYTYVIGFFYRELKTKQILSDCSDIKDQSHRDCGVVYSM